MRDGWIRAAGQKGMIERMQVRREKDPTGITGTIHCYEQ